ncbi:gamma-glutamylcyclotransferase [Jeotgalibacillus aurantiacus]|uniref:gamma-glutamylcyclotransferase n=1 Tax=Jeotgalibacillus aurantiacus TaxID=2763266 RepID=UPI001D0A695A|nr:gamma-glutamylcyclotransferase [Jeotgalibacillus aurantiacus]
MSQIFFVYGTLRKHGTAHDLIFNETLLASQAKTAGKLYVGDHLDPILVPSENQTSYGELYQVADEKADDVIKWMKKTGKVEKIKVMTDHLGEVDALTQVDDGSHQKAEEVRFNDWLVHLELDRPVHYYYAYGSCMDNERFKLASVDHLFINKIGGGVTDRLEMNYSLTVHDGGRANIIETGQPGEGVLYKVNQEALAYLFEREGVHTGMYRPVMIDVRVGDRTYEKSISFIVIDPSEEIAPPLHYATEIIRGSKNVVSDEYHKKLVQDLKEKFNVTVE